MDKNVTFDLTTKASEWLAKNGYDEKCKTIIQAYSGK